MKNCWIDLTIWRVFGMIHMFTSRIKVNYVYELCKMMTASLLLINKGRIQGDFMVISQALNELQ